MRIMYCIEDLPAQAFPAKEVDQFTKVIEDSTSDKQSKPYVKMLIPENRLFH